MKKASGFEKFFKGKEKTGGAKKEALRQDKRQTRKQREEEIAEHKRQKRAKRNAASSPPQAPKYNFQSTPPRTPPKDAGQRNKPPFSVEKKKEGFTPFTNKAGQSGPNDGSRQRIIQKSNGGNLGYSNKNDRQKPFNARGADDRKQSSDKPYNRGKQTDRNNSNRRPSNERPARPQKFEKQYPAARPQKRNQQSDKPRVAQIIVKKNVVKPKIGAGKKPQSLVSKERANMPPPTANDQMPLNKFIAHSGVCSRRDAVDLIKAGKVKVNGTLVLEPGHKVGLTDDVSVTGKHLKPVKDFIYILLNKPKDYITTTEDPQERKTVLDLLQGAPETRIYPVGRLDRNTSGVLLLTNDGDLSQKLTHPSNEIKKVYAVTLDKPLTKHHFDDILRGVQLDDGPATVDLLAYTDAKDHTQIGVELHTGRNRIVRRIFEYFGYDVKALDRVVFAGLTKKNVNRGKWRFLNEREVRDLKFFKKGRG